MLSPVTIDSSIDELPFVIIPSTGIFSPGRTTIISPIATCSIGTSIIVLFLIILAVLGCKPINFFIASDVRPFALASSHFPRITKVIKNAAVSKYKSAIFSPPEPIKLLFVTT